jgi:two-component system alkaline phosphatase synthesis response regulator PhoP
MAHRILVVDDDHQIVRLVRSYLERAGYEVLVAYDGTAALGVLRRERPDLLLLDLMLPDRDGWEITRTVRSDPDLVGLPIIMLTARVEDTDKIVGLELGGDDYIAKPFNPLEVVARVRAVLRRVGGTATPTRVLQLGPVRLDLDRHAITRDGQPVELTPTEFELLRVLMEQPGHAFTRLQLIDKALGYSYEGMERVVDSHIKNLRRKIETDAGVPTLIQTVFGVGYRARDER